MLEPAFYYANRLQERYGEAVRNGRLNYYFREPWLNYFIPIHQNSEEMIQMVSLDSGDVAGYFAVKINRGINAAYDLEIIRFGAKSREFSADLHDFFISLYEKYGFNKVSFWVIADNPAKKLYDNVIRAYGGRMVGIKKQDAICDGQLCDVVMYEILRDEFHHSGVDRFSWRDFENGGVDYGR